MSKTKYKQYKLTSDNGRPVQVTMPLLGTCTVYKYLIELRYKTKKVIFSYQDSVNAYQEGKRGLTEKDLLNTLYCFASDAVLGHQTRAEAEGNIGTIQDDTWRALVAQAKKSDKLGLVERDLNKLINDEKLQ